MTAEASTRMRLLRAFALSGISSALSFALYGVFAFRVGIGERSDVFFSVVTVTQLFSNILFLPFEAFALRKVLVGIDERRDALWSLLASFAVVSAIILIPYYTFGEHLLGPLFGKIYWHNRSVWVRDYWLGGALVPLTGFVSLIQIYCQARGKFEVPKWALALGRGLGVAILLSSSSPRDIGIPALLAANCVAFLVSLAISRPELSTLRVVVSDCRDVLRKWFHLNSWAVFLKTDLLVDRVLVANIGGGFLSVFNLAWSAMTNVIEAYQGSFVAADSNRYFHAQKNATASIFSCIRASYRRSTVAAVWLLVISALSAVAFVLVGHFTGQLEKRVPGITLTDLSMLICTILLVQILFSFWKQLAGVYTIHDRALSLTRYLVLCNLGFIIPRVALAHWLGAIGFCIGLGAYYGSQVLVLAAGLITPLGLRRFANSRGVEARVR